MPSRLPRTIVAALALVTLTVGHVAAQSDSRAPPPVELVDVPPELATVIEWATGLFEQAGLELPPLRYDYNATYRKPCARRSGLHHRVDGVNVVEICTTKVTEATEVLLLHETAHAWIDHHLTEERKRAFQQLRGWTHWRDYTAAAWHDNGTEQAAEIMVWGLIDRPIALIRLERRACDDLDAGYRTLTGQAPLHGFRDLC